MHLARDLFRRYLPLTPLIRDATGIVRGFAYHDGFLDGIAVSDRDAQLSIRSVDGERRVVALHGVAHLKLDDFRQGNIISNLWWLTVPEALRVEHVARRLTEHFGQNLPVELFVFILDSSYGAELIALCELAEVSELTPAAI
jgi:hypothetical protein